MNTAAQRQETMRIGFVGLGRMGQALVPHLLRAKHIVSVWNRTPGKATALIDAGARLAPDLADLVASSDIVISNLLDDQVVANVYSRADGLLAQPCAGRVFMDMSTIRPGTVRELYAIAEKRGATLVDAPVSGSVGPAREGKLIALVGGTPEAVERVHPVLSLFARRIEHIGPSGSGATMKIALQLPLAVYWSALAEALSIGTAAGIDPRRMLNVIADSPAAIRVLESKIPVILREDTSVAFSIAAARKDMLVMSAAASLAGVPAPVTAAALATYSDAAHAGWADKDLASLVSFVLDRTVVAEMQRTSGES